MLCRAKGMSWYRLRPAPDSLYMCDGKGATYAGGLFGEHFEVVRYLRARFVCGGEKSAFGPKLVGGCRVVLVFAGEVFALDCVALGRR